MGRKRTKIRRSAATPAAPSEADYPIPSDDEPDQPWLNLTNEELAFLHDDTESPRHFARRAINEYLGDDGSGPPTVERIRCLVFSLIDDARAYLDAEGSGPAAAIIEKRTARLLERGLRDPQAPLLIALYEAVESDAARIRSGFDDAFYWIGHSLRTVYERWPTLKGQLSERAFDAAVVAAATASPGKSESKWKEMTRLFKSAGFKGLTSDTLEQRIKRVRRAGLRD